MYPPVVMYPAALLPMKTSTMERKNGTRQPHSPPAEMPWMLRRAMSRIGASTPADSKVGRKPMSAVAAPMVDSVDPSGPKMSWLKISPEAAAQRKQSYHSMLVPTIVANATRV